MVHILDELLIWIKSYFITLVKFSFKILNMYDHLSMQKSSLRHFKLVYTKRTGRKERQRKCVIIHISLSCISLVGSVPFDLRGSVPKLSELPFFVSFQKVCSKRFVPKVMTFKIPLLYHLFWCFNMVMPSEFPLCIASLMHCWLCRVFQITFEFCFS